MQYAIPSAKAIARVSALIVITMIAGCAAGSSPGTAMVVCDEQANRYASEQDALDAGLSYAQFGATYCPEYKMHPSWDADGDGENDCVKEGSCSSMSDYMSPRPNEGARMENSDIGSEP